MSETPHSTQEIIFEFLNSVGIQIVEKKLSQDCFLPGISVLGSSALIDQAQLKHLGDILHEAGHIAVTEPKKRPLIGTKEMDVNWPTDGKWHGRAIGASIQQNGQQWKCESHILKVAYLHGQSVCQYCVGQCLTTTLRYA